MDIFRLTIVTVLVVCCWGNFLDEFHHRKGKLTYRWLKDHLPSLNQVKRDDIEACDQKPADIVFVLDSSGSIWEPDFKKQLAFVIDIIKEVMVGEQYAHIGVITFSDPKYIEVQLELGDLVDNEAQMIATINATSLRRGNTYTHLALKAMSEMFGRRARAGVPHIGIVITDGESDDPDSTRQEAAHCHDQGISIFALGVGQANPTELKSIASSSDMVYHVSKYDMLDDLKEKLAWEACTITTQAPLTTTTPTPTTTTTRPPQMFEGCEGRTPLDLLLAGPDEAGVVDTEHVLEFFQTLVSEMEIGSRQTLVGLTPRLCATDEEDFRLPAIRLGDYDMKGRLQEAIGERTLRSTLLSQQLEYAIGYGFSEEQGRRPGSKRSLVLVVDNKSMFPEEAAAIAEDARSKGIHVITVGVGRYVSKQELRRIASTPRDTFHVDTYEQLPELIERIKESLCRALLT